MRAWIRVLDAPGCYECTVRAERKSTLCTTRLRIGQNCRAVCTKRMSLMPWAIHVATARDALSNDRRESTACFEKPTKQALALVTKPRVKREARSVLCHTCTCQ